MHCVQIPTEVPERSSHHSLRIVIQILNFNNVTSKKCPNECRMNKCNVDGLSSLDIKILPERVKESDNINRHSMSPNPENIEFLNDIQQQQPNQDDEVDSGFASGGKINSRIFSSRQDYDILTRNEKELSDCGFYYPHLDSIGAVKMLKKSTVGTFLIRNSLDARFLYSLSVKTQRGATSVRIAYQEGLFSFDCDERIRKRMPQFRSVISLINHHVELSRQGVNNSWRWEEKSGRKNMVVDISKPCRTSAPSLQHLSTIAVNRNEHLFYQIILRHPFKYENALKCIRDYPFKV